MTSNAPTPQEPEDQALTETDLDAADAAEAPDIAEALADQLEAELEDIANATGGEG